jgi:hypothetical protein
MDAKTIDVIREMAKKAWNKIQDWATTQDETGRSPLDKLGDVIREQVENAKASFSPEALKVAMCYEERAITRLSFKELVDLVKKSYSLKPGMRICILKTASRDICVLDVMACDANDEIDFSPMRPWLRLVVAEIDADLVSMFGSKSMLVLK